MLFLALVKKGFVTMSSLSKVLKCECYGWAHGVPCNLCVPRWAWYGAQHEYRVLRPTYHDAGGAAMVVQNHQEAAICASFIATPPDRGTKGLRAKVTRALFIAYEP